MDDVAIAFPAIRFAPPVLEQWGVRGPLVSRTVVVDFGVAWSLPAGLSAR